MRASPLPVTGSEPALSPSGTRIAYVHNADGAGQIFIARAGGSHAMNVTHLAAQDASHPAWISDRQLLFSAAGRPQTVYTSMGQAYSIDAVIVSSLVVIAVVLMLVRRWRMPFGAMTVLFASSSIALATQADTYWDVPAAAGAGIVADVMLAVLRDRARSGNAFYAFGFIVPFALAAFYLAAVRLHDGTIGWQPNMVIGAPFIGAFAGLLISFCFAPPLPQPERAAAPMPESPLARTLVDRPTAQT